MAHDVDVLASLAKLERSSRLAIPLSLVAFVAIAAMLILSARELTSTRQKIDAADIELEQKRAEVVRVREEANRVVIVTQDRLQAADTKIENASKNSSKPEQVANLQAAREDLAVADASLAGAKVKISALPSSAQAVTRYGAMSVDIFYCETEGNRAKELAERVAGLKGSSVGRWRVRTLPAALNATEGYRVTTNVIRYNPDELVVARSLLDDAKSQGSVDFRLQEISYPTPGYISAFVCLGKDK
jgi:hypothetical protein